MAGNGRQCQTILVITNKIRYLLLKPHSNIGGGGGSGGGGGGRQLEAKAVNHGEWHLPLQATITTYV